MPLVHIFQDLKRRTEPKARESASLQRALAGRKNKSASPPVKLIGGIR